MAFLLCFAFVLLWFSDGLAVFGVCAWEKAV
ncbi:hypothetical protein J2T37_001534 [Neisseria perflava]|nr:hypothetical protein [Neisseria perflava]MCP1772729.1 hypothetical protein [Neisseria perflava]